MQTALKNKTNLLKPHQQVASALNAFFHIMDLWAITVEQQKVLLGIAAVSTFYKYKKERAGVLSQDTLERISYILGIYKALQILFPDPQQADRWIKKKNTAPLFGGRSALDRLLSGRVSDLYVVREYLDAQRGGWA